MSRRRPERERTSRSVRRISRMWLWRVFTTMLAIDFMLVLIAVGAFCYTAAKDSDAGFSLTNRRYFTGVMETGEFYMRLDNAVYHFVNPAGQVGQADAGAYFVLLRRFLALVLIAQGVVYFFQWGGGRRSAEQQLDPDAPQGCGQSSADGEHRQCGKLLRQMREKADRGRHETDDEADRTELLAKTEWAANPRQGAAAGLRSD